MLIKRSKKRHILRRKEKKNRRKEVLSLTKKKKKKRTNEARKPTHMTFLFVFIRSIERFSAQTITNAAILSTKHTQKNGDAFKVSWAVWVSLNFHAVILNGQHTVHVISLKPANEKKMYAKEFYALRWIVDFISFCIFFSFYLNWPHWMKTTWID